MTEGGMAEFATERDLTDKIRYVVGGKGVKCAVAYWGNHGFDQKDTKNWKIICDVVGGSTSPNALAALGAPENPNIKHVKNLHAKVYLSDRGAVVGSANASAGGLHTTEQSSRMLEAGVYYDSDDVVWHQATAWIDRLFESAETVDEDALELAQTRYRPPIDEMPQNFKGMSVLEQIISNPTHFADAGIGFIIVRNAAEESEFAQAAQEAASAGDISEAVLNDWEMSRSFIGWSEREMANLSSHFIEFYFGMKGGNKTVMAHQLAHRFDKVSDDDEGHFYTTPPKRQINLPDGTEFPTGNGNALPESDWRLLLAAGRMNDNDGGVWNAFEFSRLLRLAAPENF